MRIIMEKKNGVVKGTGIEKRESAFAMREI